jgi:hypothetical protein
MCMIFISIRTHILTQTDTETEKTLVVASVCLDMHGLLGQLIDPCKSVLMMFIEVERTWPIYLHLYIYTSIHPITVYSTYIMLIRLTSIVYTLFDGRIQVLLLASGTVHACVYNI